MTNVLLEKIGRRDIAVKQKGVRQAVRTERITSRLQSVYKLYGLKLRHVTVVPAGNRFSSCVVLRFQPGPGSD